MTEHNETIGSVVGRVFAVCLAWLAGIQLGEIQQFVGIVSGCAVGAYAALQFVALWRREFKGKK